MKGISVRIVHHVPGRPKLGRSLSFLQRLAEAWTSDELLLEHVSEARKAVEVAEFLEISGNS